MYCIPCILNPRERCVLYSVYSQSVRDVCILCILCILCIQIPGVYAALFEKVVACVCVCECELDATGVALSQIDKRSPCGTIRCKASDWSRKCVLTGEMCLSTENIRKALLARQTQEKERIPRDKHSFHGRDYREPQHALAVSQSIK